MSLRARLLIALGYLVALVIVFSLLTPTFLSLGNVKAMLVAAAILVILSIGQSFVITTGGIDLSISATMTVGAVGFGLGWVASPTLIAAQSSVDWSERGVVTGTNMFARSMGSAIGIAVFGAIVNATLGMSVGHGSSTAAAIPATALDPALHRVFLGATVGAVLLTVAVLAMPRRSHETAA